MVNFTCCCSCICNTNIYGSLPLGAVAALAAMLIFRVIKWKDIDEFISGGVGLMGLIAFIMLVAAGYGNIIREKLEQLEN